MKIKKKKKFRLKVERNNIKSFSLLFLSAKADGAKEPSSDGVRLTIWTFQYELCMFCSECYML